MPRLIFLPIALLIGLQGISGLKDSTVYFNLPDSVKAVQFLAEIKVEAFNGKEKHFRGGIKTDMVSLYIDNYYRGQRVTFAASAGGRAVSGINVFKDLKYGYFNLNYKWKANQTYKLLIAQTGDSAENFSLYSGYIFLPEENKWKLIGTYRTTGSWNGIKKPASFCLTGKKHNTNIIAQQAWIQRRNGSWKNLKEENTPPPVINLYSHVDSLTQRDIEIKQIEDSITAGKASNLNQHNGIYYSMMKEGNSRQVSVTDTVVAYYKGYLFANGQVFDQTKDKPATFPLSRLIKGWQIGLPLCKVGGKIKLVIPSDLGYSIRTRAAKIPPNSILVFEIEVVDVKPVR